MENGARVKKKWNKSQEPAITVILKKILSFLST
jgi:hypothetical protein